MSLKRADNAIVADRRVLSYIVNVSAVEYIAPYIALVFHAKIMVRVQIDCSWVSSVFR